MELPNLIIPGEVEADAAKRLFESVVVEVTPTNLASAKADILNKLQSHSVACVRGLVSEEVVEQARSRLREIIAEVPVDNARREEKDFETVNQKCILGGMLYNRAYNPRAQRIVYLPQQETPFQPIFGSQIRLRNLLYGFDENFTMSHDRDYFNATRVHHYPVGGGFLAPHVDQGAPEATLSKSPDYYQVSCTLTQKGEDYCDGGGYILINGEVFIFDNFTLKGDLLVYNGKTVHGVLEVDPLRVFDFANTAGRMAAFCTLFKRNYI